MVKITQVEPHSRAEKAGIRVGDLLVSLNAVPIHDVLDYRFYLAERRVDVRVCREGEMLDFSISKGTYDDIGLDFETPLMDKKHSCKNGCIFCFIDQLPKGMRESLYFKDDDSRLSFLHGNYITLTNLTDADVERICTMRFSPINISIHTTNPELRVKMMKNKRAGEVLKYLDRIRRAHLTMHGQIVLCRGINDGAELDRTLHDLAALYPELDSVSVVPAGLTDHRQGLYPLTAFSPEECGQVIDQVEAFAQAHKAATGASLVFASDEFYLKAGRPLPGEDAYEGYPQIENGVGMMTSFRTEFEDELAYLQETGGLPAGPRQVSVATGFLAYPEIARLSGKLSAAMPGLQVYVYPIENRTFGKQITVSGLLTGKDMAEQLSGKPLGEVLFFPPNALRAEGDLFLCGMTPAELSAALGVPAHPSGTGGDGFLRSLAGIEG